MRYSIRKRSSQSCKNLIAENTQAFGSSLQKSLIGEAGLSGPTDLVNSDVIDGGSLGDAVVYTIRQGCFSYADMLPVKVFMPILYSIVMKSQV